MLFQLNARLALGEIRPGATLDDLPDQLLDGLADRGIRWLYLLGAWQTGAAGRRVSRTVPSWQDGFRHALGDLSEQDIAGSPFAVCAYRCHSDFGGEMSLSRLRQRLQRRRLKLMLDFVPNHVALDHEWAAAHPEWFIHGTEADLGREPDNWVRVGGRVLAYGRDPYFPGWPDTLQLNYFHPGLREAMRDELASLATRCDGARCDMAMLLLPHVFARTWGERARPADGREPDTADFWPWAATAARKQNADFVLMAEVYWDLEWELQQQGFDYTYDKRLYDRLRGGDADPVREHLRADLDFQVRCARFLENHDEPRAAESFPPQSYRAAAVVTYLTPGLRFFHDGQWEGRRVHASIHLGRRPDEPIDEPTRAFYDRLLAVASRPEATSGRWRLLECWRAWEANPTAKNFIAWMWEGDEKAMLVVTNHGPTQGQCYVGLATDLSGRSCELRDLLGDAVYVRDGDALSRQGLYLDMPAWGYHAFEVKTR